MRTEQLLLENGLLSEEEVLEAVAERKRFGGRIARIVVQKGYCTELDLAKVLAKHHRVPLAPLDRQPVVSAAVLQRFPHPLACELNAVPLAFSETNKTLLLAVEDPSDEEGLEKVRKKTGYRLAPSVAPASAIARMRAKVYQVDEELALLEESEGKFTDGLGRTMPLNKDLLQTRLGRRPTGEQPLSRTTPMKVHQAKDLPPLPELPDEDVQEIDDFIDGEGRSVIRSIEDIRREAREKLEAKARGKRDAPSTEELLATIEVLQGEVQALKAIAVVLFKKGVVTQDEYRRNFENRAPSPR